MISLSYTTNPSLGFKVKKTHLEMNQVGLMVIIINVMWTTKLKVHKTLPDSSTAWDLGATLVCTYKIMYDILLTYVHETVATSRCKPMHSLENLCD